MPVHHPLWIEHQRKRWMAPSPERFWRPDATRWMTAEAARPVLPESMWPKEQPRKITAAEIVEEEKRQREWEAELVELRREHLELKWLWAKRKLECARQAFMAKAYNRNQPRVPAGNPDGGQWTSDGAVGGTNSNSPASASNDEDTNVGSNKPATDISAARRGKGHHYIPAALFENESLPEDTRRVFEEASTGPLRDERSNKYDQDHRQYNQAVKGHYEKFKRENGITSERMSPDQARQFVREVQDSRDPRIRNYNMRIWLREIMRRGPLRSRGND